MRTLVPPIAAILVALLCVAPARAEKWLWYQIRGGAVAYDADSRKTDAEKGVVGADTLIFYDRPRKIDEGEFSFVAERLEFQCRGDSHRWKQSAVLDAEGRILRARPDGEWEPMPKELGSTALFARILCLSQTPPGEKQAPDLTSAIAAIKQANAGAAALASLAFPSPRAAPATPRPPAPVEAAPAAASPLAAPPVTAPTQARPPVAATAAAPDPIGAVIAAAPAATPRPAPTPAAAAPKLLPAAPPPVALPAADVARSAGPGIAPPAGATPYPAADRCLHMKAGRDMNSQYAFNDCSYRVNYAWCVTGSDNPGAECGGPTIARGAGAVSPKANARSSYPGGLGRLHIFSCRAPGAPVVREAEGKLTHQCLGPAPTTAQAPAAKAAQKLPELRRLSQ
jgi:hypothetical protein